MTQAYSTLRVTPGDDGVLADGIRTAKRVINQITMPAADAFRADAVRFRALVAGDHAQARTAALFAQGLQTRGPLELDLGDRLGAL